MQMGPRFFEHQKTVHYRKKRAYIPDCFGDGQSPSARCTQNQCLQAASRPKARSVRLARQVRVDILVVQQ